VSSYAEFIAAKSYRHLDAGFDCGDLSDQMMDFQRDCVAWACRRGRAAIFADTGLGKTFMQLAWAEQVERETNRPVLVVAPLCVAQQTVREGEKFGIASKYMRDPGFSNPRIHVTNYEMLKNFDPADYAGIVLDESSILKGMDGRLRKQITEFASTIPYRLSCTATPSPNDFMELGTQSEFLGIMTQVEMLAQFFIHDGGDTSKWRLKGHARSRFWEWLATWSILIRHPADLGYSDDGYDLPPLKLVDHVVETGENDGLFVKVAQGLQERNSARRESVDLRVQKAAEIANNMIGPVLVWCHLNDESAKLAEMIDGAQQVYGAMTHEDKERYLLAFGDGDLDVLVTKPRIAGYGLNWQHCNQMIFVGLSDSWESFYQAVRRCWRFGQQREVTVHIVTADTEGAVLENIQRKQRQNDEMRREMAMVMRDLTLAEIQGAKRDCSDYMPYQRLEIPAWMS
jgi:superfamily II DNA or RNA helicase